MKAIIILIYILVFTVNLFSQSSIDTILSTVEKNSIMLSALQKRIDAEKLANKTGIFPDNPEFEFGYLWGSPSVIGNRTDMSLTQTLNFPSAYVYKNQVANLKNEQLETEYQARRSEVFLETRIVCYHLIYLNALKHELTERLDHAKTIAKATQYKFESGETNILEQNKAQLNLLNTKNRLEYIEIEINTMISELTRLNGGIKIDFTDSIFLLPEIPTDFDQWYATAEEKNPDFAKLKQDISISKKEVRLNRALGLPKIQTGYMSEKVAGEKFQGITAGVSIPLWENKNTIQHAKANTLALEEVAKNNKIEFYNRLKALHTKAVTLQNNVIEYRESLTIYNNTELLKKTLDKGEIGLLDYILEISVYYESFETLLELERDLNITAAELYKFM